MISCIMLFFDTFSCYPFSCVVIILFRKDLIQLLNWINREYLSSSMMPRTRSLDATQKELWVNDGICKLDIRKQAKTKLQQPDDHPTYAICFLLDKCIRDDTKGAARRSRNCIRKTKYYRICRYLCHTEILWKTARPRKISLKSGSQLLSYGQIQF